MSEILLGTCGWSYAEWENSLYHQKQGKLKQYSSIFPTAEIDSTFYALPKHEIVLGWARHTPPKFIFSAKLPQTITHKKTLDTDNGIEEDLNQFLEVMQPLKDAGKLECLLAQLPPFLRFNSNKLESFLALLPRSPNFAVEFRHDSWLRGETFKLLEKYQVAYTVVDEPLLPPDVHITSEIAYFRWHGRGSKPWFNYKYSQGELQEWVPKVEKTTERTKKILGYFNNHFHGYAPENCLQMMQMLGIIESHGEEALRRLAMPRRESKATTRMVGLEKWTGPIGNATRPSSLLRFADPKILAEAQSIPDESVSLREDNKQRLAAYIEDTTIDIDLERRTLVHRCQLWAKLIPEKKFCLHIIRLLLSIDPERANGIISSISPTLDNWKFSHNSQYARAK